MTGEANRLLGLLVKEVESGRADIGHLETSLIQRLECVLFPQPQRCTSCKGYGERNYGGTPYGMEECLRCDGTGLEPRPQ